MSQNLGNYSVGDKGAFKKVVPFDLLINSLTDGENFDVSHLLFYEINSEYFLVIDTFHDVVEVISKKTKEDVFNRNLTSSPYYRYYKGRFQRDKTRLSVQHNDLLKSKYNSALNAFFVCPSYNCNNRCVYCYQQYDKNLNKSNISEENLARVFEYITNEIEKIRKINTDQPIMIGLFGGEPFMRENRDIIAKILEFAREKKMFVLVTTNLQEIEPFIDLLITYNGYLGNICTTLDGGRDFHNSRRKSLITEDPFSRIIENVNTLLKIGTHIAVAINIDKSNIGQLGVFLDIAKENGWANNPNMHLEIGRVDDRLYEGIADNIISESDLLNMLDEFNKISPFPKNIKLAFIKTSLPMAERFGFSFGQNERGRLPFHYCWASSPLDNIQYIDANMDVYRCTYTVGKTRYRIGNLQDKMIFDLSLFKHNIFSNDKCWNCPIGGYCSGGCSLSHSVDAEKLCSEEKDNFYNLVQKMILPKISEKLRNIDESIS